MKITTTIIGVCLSLTFGSAIADESCADLASVIVRNKTRSFSSDETKAINKADLCIEKYNREDKTRAAQIEAAFSGFSGGGEASESAVRAEQEKQCEGRYNNFWRKNIQSNEARTISSDSLGVIKACLALQERGIKPSLDITDNGEFNFSFLWNTSPSQPLTVNYVGPVDLEGYDCSANSGLTEREFKKIQTPADVRTIVQNGGSFTMTCKRPSKLVTRDGESNTCHPETILSIVTNGPPAALKIPSVCHPSMPGKRAQAIEDQLRSANAKIDELRGQIDILNTKVAESDKRYVRKDDSTYIKKGDPLKFSFRPAENLCFFATGGNGGPILTGDCTKNNNTNFTIRNP